MCLSLSLNSATKLFFRVFSSTVLLFSRDSRCTCSSLSAGWCQILSSGQLRSFYLRVIRTKGSSESFRFLRWWVMWAIKSWKLLGETRRETETFSNIKRSCRQTQSIPQSGSYEKGESKGQKQKHTVVYFFPFHTWKSDLFIVFIQIKLFRNRKNTVVESSKKNMYFVFI